MMKNKKTAKEKICPLNSCLCKTEKCAWFLQGKYGKCAVSSIACSLNDIDCSTSVLSCIDDANVGIQVRMCADD